MFSNNLKIYNKNYKYVYVLLYIVNNKYTIRDHANFCNKKN